MKTPLAPFDLQTLLVFHIRGLDIVCDQALEPSTQAALMMLVDSGMLIVEELRDGQEIYMTTDKGKAFVEALCETPEPRCVWIVDNQTKGET